MTNSEILLYHAADGEPIIQVKLENETVWLNQAQMAELFNTSKQNISLHIKNIIAEGELDEKATVKEYLTVQKEGLRTVKRNVAFYNLDVIISVGYRVKSQRGTQFRIWANNVLKEYLLKGYVLHQRIEKIENDVYTLKNKASEFDLHIKTSLPPHEGIFFDGQIYDAYKFTTDLIKSATKSLILIDNYIDESVLLMFSKRNERVKATIYTAKISAQLKLDMKKYHEQYHAIEVKEYKKAHDRFLIIDNKEVYHIGASIKDLGKKWFAFSKISIDASKILDKLTKE